MPGKNKKRTKKQKNASKTGGQTLPGVLIMAGTLSILAMALLFMFRQSTKNMVTAINSLEKEELAGVALEHAIAKLQTGSNWDLAPVEGDTEGLEGFFKYDREYHVPGKGYYTLYILKGNLFKTGDTNHPRQGERDYRTIGIKVKTEHTDKKGRYVAVLQRRNFGGPLISKGKINLPAPDTDNTQDASHFLFFWGDIFSEKKEHNACRIPLIPAGAGEYEPQDWMPHVYAAHDIYTMSSTDPDTDELIYDYTYENMSPTTHCHPFSPYATAPEIDLNYYKMLAKRNNAYYGPATMPDLENGGGKPNPYYIDSDHRLDDTDNDVVKIDSEGRNTRIGTIMGHLDSLDPPAVLFIDTTDALPLRESPCNSYAWQGSTDPHLDVQDDGGEDGTLRLYKYTDNGDGPQGYTRGFLFVMGPLLLVGYDPDGNNPSVLGIPTGEKENVAPDTSDPMANASVRTGIPDNYYYPRREKSGEQFDDERFFNRQSNTFNSYCVDVKHAGLIYAGGELQFGGKGFGCDLCGNCSNTSLLYNDICIYGTVYIGEHGELSAWKVDDNAAHVYYNPSFNLFGFTGHSISVMTLTEISFLVPDPDPVYPESF